MKPPRPQHRRSSGLTAILTPLLLSIAMSPACADSRVVLIPATSHSGSTGISRSALATNAAAGTQLAMQMQRIGQITSTPENGFLNQAFRRPAATGKVAKVISALGLDAILQQAMVRDLLGRVHGNRFCLTEGCGVNVKMSVSKPGLRLEHRF